MWKLSVKAVMVRYELFGGQECYHPYIVVTPLPPLAKSAPRVSEFMHNAGHEGGAPDQQPKCAIPHFSHNGTELGVCVVQVVNDVNMRTKLASAASARARSAATSHSRTRLSARSLLSASMPPAAARPCKAGPVPC